MNACPLATLLERRTCAALLASVLLAAGCASPPSVMPLLQATERTLAQEAEHLDADAEREAQWLDQTRRALAEAYEADLEQTDALSVAWVREATGVYVLAREELARHEARLAAQRQRRAENLAAAGEALRLAGELLEQQDRLWLEVVGVDVWTLLRSGPSGVSGQR